MSENKETYESVVQQRDAMEKKLADVAASLSLRNLRIEEQSNDQ